MKQLLVSIVSVSFNREKGVITSVNSLLEQTYKPIEIIIIDDGSSDKTFEILSSYSDSRLKVYTHSNQGFTKTMKKAISLSKGDVIAVHGFGDVALPHWIAKQVDVLIRHSEVSVVGSFVDTLDIKDKRIIDTHKPAITDNLTNQLFKKNIFSHGGMLYRRNFYDKIGGYRAFFYYAQDYDLWLRMSLYPNKFIIINEVLYVRLRYVDSIDAAVDRKIMQVYYSDISKQCLISKMQNKKDIVSQYGERAFFFRKRTKDCAYEFCRVTLNNMRKNNFEAAFIFNKKSIDEKIIASNIIIAFMLLLIKFPPLESWVKSINLFDKMFNLFKKISNIFKKNCNYLA